MFSLNALQRLGVLFIAFVALLQPLRAQQDCVSTTTLTQGYSVSISNVTLNADGTYTITLTVLNTGCSTCKKLNSFLVPTAT
jgi:hypothetical protein